MGPNGNVSRELKTPVHETLSTKSSSFDFFIILLLLFCFLGMNDSRRDLKGNHLYNSYWSLHNIRNNLM